MTAAEKPEPLPDESRLRERADDLQRQVERQSVITRELHGQIATQTARLAASDGLFRLLIESVEDYAIFMLDPAGNVATWNAGAERFKGYRADEIIGKHFSVFYSDTEVRSGKCEHELDVAVREGRYEEEGWRLRKDGTRFWANVVITAVRDGTGELVGFAKVTRDLTERKIAEERRLADEARYRLLIESVRDYAIFILDPGGHVATWNEGARRIKGYRAEEIIGSHFSRFYVEEEAKSGKCEWELEVAARDGRFEDEGWRVRNDGSQFWANVIISAIRDRNGALVGFSKVTRDLTERKRTEEERAARLAAEEANKTKDEFLAMLGHELRNPLAPIVSALQLLKLRGDGRSLREYHIIERQVAQMTRLVDDLLDVSRIARGKVALRTARTDLRDPLAKAIEIAIPEIDRKDQHLQVTSPQHAIFVDGDDARLVQVFANLLTNASKYTHPGGNVWVGLRHVGARVLVDVRDDGIGIERELLPRVFDLFVQGYRGSDRAEGGLGLGLTLARAIVELHGGTIEARSAGRGHGSCFTVALPALDTAPANEADAPALSIPARAPATGSSRKLLVVDDNEDARSLLAEMLAAYGHVVREAPDGEAALALVESFVPDVAILDIGLPGMDGFELARRLRGDERTERVHLVALSGYAQPIDQLRGARAGFAVHLTKPIAVEQLLETIDALAQTSSEPVATPSNSGVDK